MLSLWSALTPRRRAIVAAASVGVFLGLIGLSRMAATPEMALLYGGLEGRQAGALVQALDSAAVPYEVRGDAIFVDASRRDALRMQLASEGVLAGSGAGYEILDGLSGFGTTSQMFDAAYWRAKEGELARTILAGPGIRQVRVHIAQPPSGAFRRDDEVTASVTVTAVAGGLTAARGEAYRYLVASAVPGLTPDRVTIVDGLTGRLIEHDAAGSALGSGLAAQEDALRKGVERILRARFGPENAIVEVSVSPVTEAETIRERRLDPQSRVAISSNVEEITTSERNGGGGAVTVASNLPDGDAGDAGTGSETQNAETRTVTNFEVSEVVRDIDRKPGAIRRMTVAVLVNRSALGGDDGAVDAELGDVRDLVAASVGFDKERGDSITVKALAFEPPIAAGTEAARLSLLGLLSENPLRLVQLAVLALVTLILAVFVIRPILAGRSAVGSDARGLLGQQDNMAIAAGDEPRRVPSSSDSPVPAMAAASGANITALSATGDPPRADPATSHEDPITRLKTLIEDRQPDTLEVLRTWLEDGKIGENA